MSEEELHTIKLVAVAGARPNFMKIAPLLRELDSRARFATVLVHTGQHYDSAMSGDFFADLGIRKPDLNLEVGSGTHAEMTAEVLRRVEPILVEHAPHGLLVVGDVNSTLAATIAASKLGIPVAHVEAGLRSFDRTMPEEINRVLTDSVSDFLFVTERSGAENLEHEGVAPERIHFVGNVMIDTLLANLERASESRVLETLGLEPRNFAVLTLHRPSNVDDPAQLRALFHALEEIHREVPIVFPVHPRTAAAIEQKLGGVRPGLVLVDPMGYLDFLRLLSQAQLVLTDSGGIQEETTVLGVPCLTLRENTERPVTISQGTNRLVGSDPDALLAAFRHLMDDPPAEAAVPELWDGGAAKRIVDVLERDLGARV